MSNSSNSKESRIEDSFAKFSDFSKLIIEAYLEMKKVGHWLESGTIEHQGDRFSYKIRRLKT